MNGMHPVRSHFIAAVGYVPLAPEVKAQAGDAADGFLVFQMRTGEAYAYLVPFAVAEEMAESGSVGRFYNQRVRGKLPAVKVDDVA